MKRQRIRQFVLMTVSLLPLAMHAQEGPLPPTDAMLPPSAETLPPSPAGMLPPTGPAVSLPQIDVAAPPTAKPVPRGATSELDLPSDAKKPSPAAPAPSPEPAPAAVQPEPEPEAPPADTPSTKNASAPKIALNKLPASMGGEQLSIFFTPDNIREMAEALHAYEGSPGTPVIAPQPTPVKQEQQEIEEPASYPVFYLSSIAFRANNDWSIWVSGRKITSRKNPTTLRILNVTANQVSFSWEPTYKEALAIRTKKDLFAPTGPVKNRLTKTPSYRYNELTGVITFTLKANQSLTVGYMNTFEGYMASPSLAKLDPSTREVLTPSPAAGTPIAGKAPPSDATAGAAAPDQDEIMELRKPASVSDSVSEGSGAARSAIDAELERSANLPPTAPSAQ